MASRPTLERWVSEALSPSAAGAGWLEERIARATHALRMLDARAIVRTDREYPAGFHALPDPPAVLFASGDALPAVGRTVAIVGSRAASPHGTAAATRLAGDLVRFGLVVASGLARGIDAAAHRGALAAGGRTVAVLPSGLDCVTPRHHRALADEIRHQGALVTERACGPPRFRGEFVRRNRLIAALAGATVVVEAAAESGALSTASVARRLGRAVLAMPGDTDRPTTRGSHALLRAGARVCEDAEDVRRALAEWREGDGGGGGTAEAPLAERLLQALDHEPRRLDDLAARSGLPAPDLLATLLALEWAGSVVAHPGQRWARSSR